MQNGKNNSLASLVSTDHKILFGVHCLVQVSYLERIEFYSEKILGEENWVFPTGVHRLHLQNQYLLLLLRECLETQCNVVYYLFAHQ